MNGTDKGYRGMLGLEPGADSLTDSAMSSLKHEQEILSSIIINIYYRMSKLCFLY